MANRPLFVPRRTASAYVVQVPVEFKWFAGLAVSQKQKSIAALHEAGRLRLPVANILEISSKSSLDIGIRLSAFNLSLQLDGSQVSVEAAFQAGKVFERGGPYTDLLIKTAREAKGDQRLRESGRLTGFSIAGDPWPTEPKTAFYDWLYLQALKASPDLADQLLKFDAFTDIEFNPEKFLNCQARSAALFVSLHREGLLGEAMSGKDRYLRLLGFVGK